ncbi:alpha-N-acetylglucosaminidase N-terminal domain-containing protein, partial [Nonomuraea sp. RK-328]|nr:alpha-N-acetylglucosaminidase N-terminal domain-containing protein [Nonomuraea sp. RK-328]
MESAPDGGRRPARDARRPARLPARGGGRHAPQPAPARLDGPAAQALERLIGTSRAKQVTLRAIDKGTGRDRFEVFAENGGLVVAGTTPAVQLTGFGHYLRQVAHADVSINGTQVDLPEH